MTAHGRAAGSYDDWKIPDLRRTANQVGVTGWAAMTPRQPVKARRVS